MATTMRANARHRLYRLTLYLYPRAYRQEYGDQMVQTLQDMLDGQPTSGGRAMVWLRVALETPLSVIKEISNSKGEDRVNKLAVISNKRLLVGGLAIVCALAMFGIFRGRFVIIEGAAKLVYGRQLSSLVADQSRALGDPFASFVDADESQTMRGCYADRAIRLYVSCNASIHTSIKLSQYAADKARNLTAAKAITAALQREGYKGMANGGTPEDLITSLYDGKSSLPDTIYYKKDGKRLCNFAVIGAYSRPAQPSLEMVLNCGRLVDPFGRMDNIVPNLPKGI